MSEIHKSTPKSNVLGESQMHKFLAVIIVSKFLSNFFIIHCIYAQFLLKNICKKKHVYYISVVTIAMLNMHTIDEFHFFCILSTNSLLAYGIFAFRCKFHAHRCICMKCEWA